MLELVAYPRGLISYTIPRPSHVTIHFLQGPQSAKGRVIMLA